MLPLTYRPNLKFLTTPIMKIWEAVQNVQIGLVGALMGHSRSSAMSPFDRAHTTSYSTLIETMRLSCTVFKISSYMSKVADFDRPHAAFGAPAGEWSRSNFAEIFSNRKLESMNYRVLLFVWSYRPTFSRFSRTPTCDRQTDGRTDGQTQGHGIYRACIASRGKKLSQQNVVHDQQSVSHWWCQSVSQ